MQNFILSFFKKTCKHQNALLHSDEGYCPDCGKYLRKYYYITRCNCCEVKRDAKSHFGKIVPSNKFCTNCGGGEYRTEKLEKLNFVDINFAIEVKEVINTENCGQSFTQIWVDNNENAHQEPFELLKLLKTTA